MRLLICDEAKVLFIAVSLAQLIEDFENERSIAQLRPSRAK